MILEIILEQNFKVFPNKFYDIGFIKTNNIYSVSVYEMNYYFGDISEEEWIKWP